MSYLKFLLIAAFALLITNGCSLEKNTLDKKNEDIGLTLVNKKQLWSAQHISLVKENEIGSDDLKDDRFIFARISDIETDQMNNLYVLDISLMRISKFNPQGDILGIIALSSGNGPGEFLKPRKLAIARDGKMYISDDNRKKIIVLDSFGNFIDEFSIKLRISQLEVDYSNNIYICGFLFSYTGPIIQKYDPKYNNYVQSFCKRYNLGKDFDLTGNTGRIAIGKNNQIYYSFEYPYEIRKFNQNGKILQRFGRKLSCYKPPVRDAERNLVRSMASAVAIHELSDGLILNLYRCRIKDDLIYYMDLFDQNQHYLKTISLRDQNIDLVRNFCVDDDDNIYMDFMAPYPHIVKYKMEKK